MKHGSKQFINILFPALIFGSMTGVLTALFVTLYKLSAKHVIEFSEQSYHFIKTNLWMIPIVLVLLFGIAFVFSFIYKNSPRLRGGGIPSSIAILRGIVPFNWIKVLFGVLILSMISFLIGVPLGNEGPSVLIGTALGYGTVHCLAPKHRAWNKYSMTGGACAGFAVATGAPVSGILFAIEEAHQRISPMIITVSAISVLFACITAQLLSSLLGVNVSLFPTLQTITLTIKDVWLPLIIGILVGLFAVLFLKYYKVVNAFFNKTLNKIPTYLKIFSIFALTLGLGLYSFSFISTGHELILNLLDGNGLTALITLTLILIVRSTLTLSANTNKINGGIFLPILALGALASSIIANILIQYLGLNVDYYQIILALGITACIAGMMKMPLTAIVFAIEALSCHNNILYIIVVSAVSFTFTELFHTKSINDSVVDNIIKNNYIQSKTIVYDAFVTVQKGSFATGKQIRDILWPANTFILSTTPNTTHLTQVDEHGGESLREGDLLHVRYSTRDSKQTKIELLAIVGEQDFVEKETYEV